MFAGDADPSERKSKRGVRILCIDGGGTKALACIEMLKELEKRTGTRVDNMFDLIGGVRYSCSSPHPLSIRSKGLS